MKEKKPLVKLVLIVLLAMGLSACSNQSSQTSTTKTSSQTSQTSSETSSSSAAKTSSASEVTSAQQQESLPQIETGAILKADYSSMAGTWTNAEGDSLTFNAQGLSTAGLTASFLDIDQTGVLLLNVDKEGKANMTLYIIPANKALDSSYFTNGASDSSDIRKDRIIASDTIHDSHLTDKVYYRRSAQ